MSPFFLNLETDVLEICDALLYSTKSDAIQCRDSAKQKIYFITEITVVLFMKANFNFDASRTFVLYYPRCIFKRLQNIKYDQNK